MNWLKHLTLPFLKRGIVVGGAHRLNVILLIMVFALMAMTVNTSIALPFANVTIVYVKKGATGAANGTSWNDAYPELSTALTAAGLMPGFKEIWVAQGEYKPTATLDRTISFKVPDKTSLFGGFIGNEISKEARAMTSNRTVLSGDLGKQFDYGDNSYHVLFTESASSGFELDRFIVAYGNADGASVSGDERNSGAGFYCSRPGAGINVTNVTFENNRGSFGGAVVIYLQVSNVGPTFIGCEFRNNSAQALGAAMGIATYDGSHDIWSTFVNSTFIGNSTQGLGAVCVNLVSARFINCSASFNQGNTILNGAPLEIENSIFWKNFTGSTTNPTYASSIEVPSGSPIYPVAVKNSIFQGGYGSPSDNNIDIDPMFVREPSFVGVFPRTSILPVSLTNPKYENQLEFSGPKMWGLWPYVAFHDHIYNKTYMLGSTVQILDYNNLVDNKPTSTIHSQYTWPRTQRPDRLYHTASNTVKFAVIDNGILSVHRQTGALSLYNVATGEATSSTLHPNDLVIDDANNLLYTPVFARPGNTFYGLLELNLTTQAKRWITTSSSPVGISGGVALWNDEAYWGGFRLYLDDAANVLYYSTGNGLWWWNRTTNATGLYNTTGGIPVAPGNPQIPTNLTTGVYVDNVENKVYIGTHQGLYVWNRNNNTSRVYNTTNSKLIHNLINTIDKNEERHLIYVACEDGALLTINTQTGDETLISRDVGSPTFPQYMDVSAASAFYDEVDKKLWVSADHTTGGTWIADYGNLVPDYGDLRLRAGSPAIDKGNPAALPSLVTTDITGLPRFVDYPTLAGANSLDLGAYERPFELDDEPPAPIPANVGVNYVLSYSVQREDITDMSAIDSYATRDVNRSIQYFDGLGRPLQSIAIQGSPTKRDIITPVVYDAYGREARKYLPFTQASNDGAYVPTSTIINDTGAYTGIAGNFYDGAIDETVAPSTEPFSETVYEPSPLNRPEKDYAPGLAWAKERGNKPVSHFYQINVYDASGQTPESEAIIVWKINGQGIPSPASTPIANYVEPGGYYSSNQLSIKLTVDEEGHAVREYTNKQGQVILKKVQATANTGAPLDDAESWAFTYYVYDDLDNLVFVIQPEGYKQYLLLSGN